jgi:hypothetical protein
MNDEEWKDSIRKIDNPVKMLDALREFRGDFGDRYYRDMEDVLWKQVDKILGD